MTLGLIIKLVNHFRSFGAAVGTEEFPRNRPGAAELTHLVVL
jgi:hypothetical protein